jgi:hypothetical protein
MFFPLGVALFTVIMGVIIYLEQRKPPVPVLLINGELLILAVIDLIMLVIWFSLSCLEK